MRWTLQIVIPVFILAIGATGMFVLARKPDVATKPAEQLAAPAVETTTVEPHTSGLDIEVDGVVVPYRELSLAAEVAGRVAYKAEECRGGNYVTKGTLLLEIDPRDYEFQVKQLQEELEQAGYNLAELEAESKSLIEMIDVAEETWKLQSAELKRQQQLAQRRVATATQLDEAKAAQLRARNEVLQLRKQLQMLESRRSRLQAAQELMRLRLQKARIDLARTQVIAPVDGVVVQDMVEQDSYVNKGTQLVTFEDTSKVEVKCNLQMDELYWLWMQWQSSGATDGVPGETASRLGAPSGVSSVPGGPPPGPLPEGEGTVAALNALARRDYQLPRTPATIVYELAGRRFEWDGVLSRYEGIGLDSTTRMVPARVVVEHPRQVRVSGKETMSTPHRSGPPALVRGMYVTVRLHAEPNVAMYSVPERAIRPGDWLWLVEDGQLRKVRVRVIEVMGGRAIIRPRSEDSTAATLLNGGAQAVISPLAVAEEGMAVRVEKREAVTR